MGDEGKQAMLQGGVAGPPPYPVTKYPDLYVPFRHFPDVGEKIWDHFLGVTE